MFFLALGSSSLTSRVFVQGTMTVAEYFCCYIELSGLWEALQFIKPSFSKKKQKYVQEQVLWTDLAWVQVN